MKPILKEAQAYVRKREEEKEKKKEELSKKRIKGFVRQKKKTKPKGKLRFKLEDGEVVACDKMFFTETEQPTSLNIDGVID